MNSQIIERRWLSGPPTIFWSLPTSSRAHLYIKPIAVQDRPPEVSQLAMPVTTEGDSFASLTSLDELIAQLKSSESGRRAYATADREWERKAQELIRRGRLSRLRYRRIKAGLTQEALAKLTGMKQPNLQRLESPIHRGRLASYQRIAGALKCDYRELLP